MKSEFQFSNLLGTVYSQGNIVFTPDGTHLLSPVGNRVTVFDLLNNKSHTLPIAHRQSISRLALHPRGNLLLSVDENGKSVLTNVHRRIALYHFSFNGRVSTLQFSPCGRYFAAGVGRLLEIWQTPAAPDIDNDGQLELAPFVHHRSLTGHHDVVQSVEWSSDSRFLLTASQDFTARIWHANPEQDFLPTVLVGHRDGVVAAWFTLDQESIYSVGRDGALFQWAFSEPQHAPGNGSQKKSTNESLRWRITKRHFFYQTNAKVDCSAYHSSSGLLAVGFSSGIFCLYELPDFSAIHTLSISQNGIDYVAINPSGEWLAFGASKFGQLLVWEWQSESYILKQQGHFDTINALTYSPDGQQIITVADDGKIKVWDVQSGFCIVTFTEHSAAVTACEFVKKGRVLVTASLDGSVRAWDLLRYRNFRTLTAPSRLPFSCLAVDPSGDVICAGSSDSFEIYIWSLQTGQLLDRLAGHEGPLSSLSFASNGGILVSGSWDHTVRLWNIFGRTQTNEPLNLQADVLDLAIRPDSKQIAVATLDGQLTFWSLSDANQETEVSGRGDISGGRRLSDRRTAANTSQSKVFHTIVYNLDGSCLLAAGRSKYICLYDVLSGCLVKKFTVSINQSLDGTQEYLNSRFETEAGPKGLLRDRGNHSDLEERTDRTLPGVNGGNLGSRSTRPELRVSAVTFSPTARSFCASSTEGLMIYSLDNDVQFDPFDLETSITPATILAALGEDSLRALVMAFRLNEKALITRVYRSISPSNIRLVVRSLPKVYLPRLLRLVAQCASESPHIEFDLLWIESMLSEQSGTVGNDSSSFITELRAVQRAVNNIQAELTRVADDNTYVLDYLLCQPAVKLRLHDPELGKFKELSGKSVNVADVEAEWNGIDDLG